jgi:hypothetical protein
VPRVPESPPRISLRYKKWQDLHLRQPFPFFLLSSSITHTLQRPRPPSTTSINSQFYSNLSPKLHNPPKSINMPPKGAAEKKPAAKAPAAKAPAEKKDAGKKTAATGEKKKRTKTRKETYSSYIYKGEIQTKLQKRVENTSSRHFNVTFITNIPQFSSRSTRILVSPTVPCLS